jgi:hypothetical protein
MQVLLYISQDLSWVTKKKSPLWKKRVSRAKLAARYLSGLGKFTDDLFYMLNYNNLRKNPFKGITIFLMLNAKICPLKLDFLDHFNPKNQESSFFGWLVSTYLLVGHNR